METGLRGKTALVTGGSRGIGRAICLALAAEGARVSVNFNANAAAAEETCALIAQKGGMARAYQADVADENAVRAMVDRIAADMGPIDLLAANAGTTVPEEPLAFSTENWRHMMSVNADGTFLTVAAIAPGMVARGYGRIVCIASVAALRPRSRMAAYSASKAAVIAFARCCSESLGPDVRINCVAPGLIDTELAHTVPPDAQAAMMRETPLGRIGKPEEIADMTVFLLSDRSAYTTGQVVVASGGRVTLP